MKRLQSAGVSTVFALGGRFYFHGRSQSGNFRGGSIAHWQMVAV
jgi:hypothetical protein